MPDRPPTPPDGEQQDDRGETGQQPGIGMTGQGLDPPGDPGRDEADAGRGGRPGQRQQDPRQPGVGRHEIRPLELGHDRATEDGHDRGHHRARPRPADAQREEPRPDSRREEVEEPGHVEGHEGLQLVDQPVGRVERPDLTLGIEREAEPQPALPQRQVAVDEGVVEEDGQRRIDLGQVQVPQRLAWWDGQSPGDRGGDRAHDDECRDEAQDARRDSPGDGHWNQS